jgi:hypothetical protein
VQRTKSGKKFGVGQLIDDDTLRAIGHVSAQWAVLEIEFDILLGPLLRHPTAKSSVPNSMPQGFDRRAKLFTVWVKLLLNDQHDLQKQLVESPRPHRLQIDTVTERLGPDCPGIK